MYIYKLNRQKKMRPFLVCLLMQGLLDQTSYNPTSHKATTVRTLTRRAQIVCDSDDSLTDEIKHLSTVLLRTTTTQISSNAILTLDRTTALTTHTPLQPLYLAYGAPPKP